jgi:hypothetical protein
MDLDDDTRSCFPQFCDAVSQVGRARVWERVRRRSKRSQTALKRRPIGGGAAPTDLVCCNPADCACQTAPRLHPPRPPADHARAPQRVAQARGLRPPHGDAPRGRPDAAAAADPVQVGGRGWGVWPGWVAAGVCWGFRVKGGCPGRRIPHPLGPARCPNPCPAPTSTSPAPRLAASLTRAAAPGASPPCSAPGPTSSPSRRRCRRSRSTAAARAARAAAARAWRSRASARCTRRRHTQTATRPCQRRSPPWSASSAATRAGPLPRTSRRSPAPRRCRGCARSRYAAARAGCTARTGWARSGAPAASSGWSCTVWAGRAAAGRTAAATPPRRPLRRAAAAAVAAGMVVVAAEEEAAAAARRQRRSRCSRRC